MRVKKTGLIFSILILAVFSLSFASAANECVIKTRSQCTGGGQFILLGLSSVDNAHAETSSSTSYSYVLCCNFGNGIQGDECSQAGTAHIIKLSSTTNAHVEKSSGTSYPYEICYKDSGTNFACETPVSGSCSAGYNAILSISGATNAHIAGPDVYNQKICCNVQGGISLTPNAYWSETAGGTQVNSTSRQVGESLYMTGRNLDVTEGEQIDLEIWEDDGFLGDDYIRTITTTISGGGFSTAWAIQQADLNAASESSPYEFYFIAKHHTSGTTLKTSNIVTLTITAGAPIGAYWSNSPVGEQVNSLTRNLGGDIDILGKNLGVSNGEEVDVEIYERDLPPVNPNDLIRTETATVDGGNISTYWTVTATDLEATGEYTSPTDYSFDEFYFVIKTQSGSTIATSNDLNLTIAGSTAECLTIDFCSDYTDQTNCELDACNAADSITQVDCSDPSIGCMCWWDTETGTCNDGWGITNGTDTGTCQITQNTADDCSDGFLSFTWIGTWIGAIIPEEKAKCEAGGSETIPCPAQIQLPFFSLGNVIAIILLAIIIYIIISMRKTHKKKRKK